MVRRITTNGMMTTYRSNLMKSYNNLANISEKVTTQRNFNSYAESPAKANQAFQMRRNRWNTENQIANSKQVVHKFQQGWDCLQDAYQDLGHALGRYSKLRADNDADAGGRKALGEVIKGSAESIMETMNAKYGENFIFSGADGQNVAFEWSTDDPPQVLYRGMPVDVLTPTEAELKDDSWRTATVKKTITETVKETVKDTDENGKEIEVEVEKEVEKEVDVPKYEDYAKLMKTIEEEHTYVDLGMGMKETEDKDGVPGKLIESSAFDTSINGAEMIGFGYQVVTMNDGREITVPKNVISILNRMGSIMSECSAEDGSYPDGDFAINPGDGFVSAEDMAEALEKALENSLDELHTNYVELDTEAKFVNTNQLRLESLDDSLNEQIIDTEDIDPADAITALMWAQYSYNAALRIGTNLLSQSLIDYMN